MLLVRRVIFFFFFKQKTAYEMRISDWSSDVCSSDLGRVEQIGEIAELVADLRDDAILLRDRPAAAILAVLARAREPQRIAVSDVAESCLFEHRGGRGGIFDRAVRVEDHLDAGLPRDLDGIVVGRAACREHVGQYV